MTDLEATRLCAEAMGYENPRIQSGCRGTQYVAYGRAGIYATEFRPLHDDAQAMALVKRFHIYVAWDRVVESWEVEIWCDRPKPIGYRKFGPDLNRAIVYCVAAMQQAKSSV